MLLNGRSTVAEQSIVGGRLVRTYASGRDRLSEGFFLMLADVAR